MAAQQTTSSAGWRAGLARYEAPRLARLAVVLGVLALVLSVAGLTAVALRPHLEAGPSSAAAGATLTMTAEAYTFTDPDEAAAVYMLRNSGLLPVTVRSGPLEDGGAVDVLDTAGSDVLLTGGPVASRTVRAGQEFAVRVTADWPPCRAFGSGSGVLRTQITLATTVLGVPGRAVVELRPGLGLEATDPVEAAGDCEDVLHAGEGW